MPYVNVPNDLSKIKTKIAFNLTKRQLICFGAGAAIGVPTYLLTRQAIGNTGALFAMLAIMLPAFLLAMYALAATVFRVLLGEEKLIHGNIKHCHHLIERIKAGMLAVVFVIHDRARSTVNDKGQILLCHSLGFARPLYSKTNLCKI